MSEKYSVRAVHCDHAATDAGVYEALKRATDPLEAAWQKLENAQRITVKLNQAWPPERLVHHEGRLQELVDYGVARALFRLLRERTDAELFCTEISTSAHGNPELSVEETITLMPLLREFDVTFVDGNRPPHKVYPVPGGGLMFSQYLLPTSVVDTDAFISVQKIKSHKFMGVTLCLKNLFGLTPMEPHGRSRRYFHHLVRLPYILVDLGQIIKPTLNIVDALVGQSEKEWGGEGRVCDTLVAGDDVIATDACATHLMGHDPLGDWPEQPFVRERNSLLIAHESGFGTADLSEIDFKSEVDAPVASFHTEETDPFETVRAWRRSTCEQALYYRDYQEEFVDRYAGEYILLQDNEVRWHGETSQLGRSRRELAGPHKLSAMWFKYVDPEEAEGEHYEVYEDTLARLEALD
ncbi:MAG: DUF362 domain-containing protein [Chloroflexota bacterium]|nr:DUF362 domain-containing protein [Chloroflexota bacterium]